MNEFKFHTTPKEAGYYCIGTGFKIAIRERPLAIHRLFVRLVFGWTWQDSP